MEAIIPIKFICKINTIEDFNNVNINATHLIFGFYFDEKINMCHIYPNNITHLTVGHCFNQQIKLSNNITHLIFVYEFNKAVFLISISGKKAQQEVIDVIKANLDVYKEQLERILKNI